MTAHSLAIAKASLAAGMMRPDPAPVTRAEVARLHELLGASLSQCTTATIQQCKDWLLKNTTSSATRTAAIAKYLVALSASFTASGKGVEKTDSGLPRRAPARRKQLHILYLLNDLLHHTKYHNESSAAYSTLTANLQHHLVDLFGHASAYDSAKFARHHQKLNGLLDIWGQHGYYQSSYIEKLRETVTNAAGLGYGGEKEDIRQRNGTAEDVGGAPKKDSPYIMPASHGDSSTPYYDLPAGNMMPHIIPNSSAPIIPQLVKPMQFVAGPADESLAMAMREFLQDVESLYSTGVEEGKDVVMEFDELGQPAIRDEITGELIEGEGYYGWSRAFCEKMKRRRDGKDQKDASPQTRRRYSYSESSRSRSRSPSRSRSRSRTKNTMRSLRKRSFSSSRSSSRSRQRFQTSKNNRPISRRRAPPGKRSRSRSYSPVRDMPAHSQPPVMPQTQMPFSAPPPLPNSFSGIPLGFNGLPTPPPPPPNYKGPWPPPPPPLPPQMQSPYSAVHAGPYPHFSALVPPPPPPHIPPPADPRAPGPFQQHYDPISQQTQSPQATGVWPPRQGNNIGRGAYGGRGGSQSGRGYRDGWH